MTKRCRLNATTALHRHNHPPTTYAEYGTGESTMSQTAQDLAADLLYSNNFAVHALHEAAAATGDPALAAAAAALRVFLLRAPRAPCAPAASRRPRPRPRCAWKGAELAAVVRL